jgi:hypothetical protein
MRSLTPEDSLSPGNVNKSSFYNPQGDGGGSSIPPPPDDIPGRYEMTDGSIRYWNGTSWE